MVTAKKSKPCHYQLKSKYYTTESEGKMRRKKTKMSRIQIRLDMRTNNEAPRSQRNSEQKKLKSNFRKNKE